MQYKAFVMKYCLHFIRIYAYQTMYIRFLFTGYDDNTVQVLEASGTKFIFEGKV